MPTTNDILGVIMGGGRGSRLYPLTKLRSKPAVPIAGKYRLIDIPISNCINSEIYPHRDPDPVQFCFAAPAYLQHLSLRRVPHRLGADPGCRADHGKRGLVPGHGGCCPQAVVRDPDDRSGVRPDPGRRPSLPHGLCRDGRISLGEKCRYNGGSSTRRERGCAAFRAVEARS